MRTFYNRITRTQVLIVAGILLGVFVALAVFTPRQPKTSPYALTPEQLQTYERLGLPLPGEADREFRAERAPFTPEERANIRRYGAP